MHNFALQPQRSRRQLLIHGGPLPNGMAVLNADGVFSTNGTSAQRMLPGPMNMLGELSP